MLGTVPVARKEKYLNENYKKQFDEWHLVKVILDKRKRWVNSPKRALDNKVNNFKMILLMTTFARSGQKWRLSVLRY